MKRLLRHIPGSSAAYHFSRIRREKRRLRSMGSNAEFVENYQRASGGRSWIPTHRTGAMMAVSAGVVLVLLAGGLFYFRRMERTFADVV